MFDLITKFCMYDNTCVKTHHMFSLGYFEYVKCLFGLYRSQLDRVSCIVRTTKMNEGPILRAIQYGDRMFVCCLALKMKNLTQQLTET